MIKSPPIFSFKHSNISGISLIEIFVAITISLIMLAAILQVFLQSKTTSNISNAFAQLQENERFIHTYVSRVVHLAGYRSLPPSGSTYTDIDTIFNNTTAYVTGTFGTGVNGSDTLTIRYQGSGNGTGTPDGTVVDCLNNAVDANTIVTNVFSLTANNELQCQAINPNAAVTNSTQVLISGVENFKVLYGEDLDGNFSADRYVPANYAFLNLGNIMSVRLSFLMRSDSEVEQIANSTSYYLLGTTYTTPSDRFLRTQLTMTILLRNLMTQPF